MKMRKGFTLVELLIVIVIIGVLAGTMMLSSSNSTDQAEAMKIASNLRSLKAAVVQYQNKHGALPTHATDLKDYTGWVAVPDGYGIDTANKRVFYHSKDIAKGGGGTGKKTEVGRILSELASKDKTLWGELNKDEVYNHGEYVSMPF